jgi:hypothetical protein
MRRALDTANPPGKSSGGYRGLNKVFEHEAYPMRKPWILPRRRNQRIHRAMRRTTPKVLTLERFWKQN